MKIRKKWLIVFVSFLLLSVALLWALPVWLGPYAKRVVVEELNSALKVPVQVEDMNFSLVRKFPNASVELYHVQSRGSDVNGNAPDLFVAEHLFFEFSWWDVLSGKMRLKRISAENASVNLYVDKRGKTNFDIFKESDSTSSDMDFELSEVNVENFGFCYRDISSSTDLAFLFGDFSASGLFHQTVYELSGRGDFSSERLKLGSIDYLGHKKVVADVQLKIDRSRQLYEVLKSNLVVEGLSLDLQGSIRPLEKATALDLDVSAGSADLKGLLSVLPGVFTERWNRFKCDGSVYFDMRIAGDLSSSKTPSVQAKFGAKNATLTPEGSPYSLRDISFEGTFQNAFSGSKKAEQLHLKSFRASLQGQPVKADLLLENFKDPYIRLSASTRFNLEVLSKFYMPDTVESMSGEVVLNASLSGKTRMLTGWDTEGGLDLKDVGFRLKGSPVSYEKFNGSVTLEGARLRVSDFGGTADGSDFQFNGLFENVYGYFLTDDQSIRGNANLVSRNLDLNELLEDKSPSKDADTIYRIDFGNRMHIALNLNVGILSFRKFQAWQCTGTIRLDNKVLSGENLAFKAFDGYIVLNGKMDATPKDSFLLGCEAQIRKIDVTELFSQLGNFGQNTMTDENVKGKLTADVVFASTWSKDLHCNDRTIYAKSNLQIDNGELIGFEPMKALSRYLKSTDLNHIRFATLQNTIEIKNRLINIPAMEIRSSALDLTASGTHSFDNVVDYNLELYLSQLLGKKVKESTSEFGTIENDGLGRLRLFLTMKGPVDNPRVKYNRIGVEKKIVHDLKKEKVVLKQILNKEFGWYKGDTTVKTKQNVQEEPQELELDLDEN